MVYNYRNVMSGFSARLTPSELEAVKSKQANFISSLISILLIVYYLVI